MPLNVLAPGQGKTHTGRLWVYVCDDRNAGSTMPTLPAVKVATHSSIWQGTSASCRPMRTQVTIKFTQAGG